MVGGDWCRVFLTVLTFVHNVVDHCTRVDDEAWQGVSIGGDGGTLYRRREICEDL